MGFIELLFWFIVLYALVILLGATDSHTENGDYLIVLGSSLQNNAITPCLKDRCDAAVKYLNKNKTSLVIVSGGLTGDSMVTEASVMKDYLISKGIDNNRIIVEDKALDTVENIKYSLTYIKPNSKVVILSNNYHLFRAKMIARLYGINSKGIGVKTETIELLKHLLIEEIFIIKNYRRIKKELSV